MKIFVTPQYLPPNHRELPIKGTVSRDFRPSVFFRQLITPRPLINTLKYFRILFRIRRAIRPTSLIPRYAA
jgi:hypothetical protein